MAKHARRVVKSNGLEDVVTVIQGAVEEVILPEEDWEQFSLSREEGDDEELVDGKRSQRVVDIILSGERNVTLSIDRRRIPDGCTEFNRHQTVRLTGE